MCMVRDTIPVTAELNRYFVDTTHTQTIPHLSRAACSHL